jgi:hypothetical protein
LIWSQLKQQNIGTYLGHRLVVFFTTQAHFLLIKSKPNYDY